MDTTNTYKVEGMTCSHCKSSVESKILQLDGISQISALPNKNEVVITGTNINNESIKYAIEELGYKFKGEK